MDRACVYDITRIYMCVCVCMCECDIIISIYIYIYIYIYCVIPKTLKMVLDTCFLNSQHYKVPVKGNWSNPEKGVILLPTSQGSSY